MKRVFLSTIAAVALVGWSSPALADDITGTMTISGNVFYDNLWNGTTITDSEAALIDFLPLGGGEGTLGVTIDTATGYFATIGLDTNSTEPNLAFGDIRDITNVITASGLYGPGLPATGTDFLHSFESTFNGPTGLHFDAIAFLPQSGPDCFISRVDGCVASDIFKLGNVTGAGVSVTFAVIGFFINGMDSGFYLGQFGAEFIEAGDVATMLANIHDNHLDIFCSKGTAGLGCSWSATFVEISSVVPEPASLLLFGTGAAFLAARRRRSGKLAKV